jgi:hypothetical protein
MGADRIAVLVRCDEEDVTPYRIQAQALVAMALHQHHEVDTHFGPGRGGCWESWYLVGEPLFRLSVFVQFVEAEEIRPPHYALTPDGRVRLWHLLDFPAFLDANGDCWVVQARGY